MKPRLRFVPSGEWMCCNDKKCGFGSTPAQAYLNWYEKRIGQSLRINQSGLLTFAIED